MAGEYAFNLINVTKQHEKKTILADVNLSFYHGAHIGVIGANGSGKSSLLKILAGLDKEFMGECQIAKNTRIGYLSQEPGLDNAKTVIQCVEEGVAGSKAMLARYDAICEKLGEDISDEESEKLNDELGRLQDTIDHNDLWSLDHHIEMAMEALRLPPSDASVAPLSGGERRRVAMCRILISNPDVLLLDEPTNHLDAESVEWLEQFLTRFPGTVVAITHDRYFLDNVAGWILELDRGNGYPYEGNYSGWLEQKKKRLDVEQKQDSARKRTLEHELEWVRMAPRARQAKSKARLSSYESLLAEDNKRKESETSCS